MKLGSYKVRVSEVERFLKEYEGYDLTDLENIKPLEEWDATEKIS